MKAKPTGRVRRPALIPVSEFAERMNISLSTARRLCYAHTVATVKFNRSLLVPASEVERLIAAHLQPARLQTTPGAAPKAPRGKVANGSTGAADARQ